MNNIEWQLFYAGKIDEEDEFEAEHIYLIEKGCINNTYLPVVIKDGKRATNEKLDENGETVIEEARPINVEGSDYKAFFQNYNKSDGVLSKYSSILENITDLKIKKLNSNYFKYIEENNKNSNGANIKTTSYMLDTTTWRNFAGKNAEYAIEGPTIELFFKAYNKYKDQGELYKTKVDKISGYSISINNGDDFASSYNAIEKDTEDKDNPYCSNKGSYWIASPAATNSNQTYYTMVLWQNGIVGIWANATGYTYSSQSNGFRPIICLNPEVSIEKIKDTNGNDVFRIVE